MQVTLRIAIGGCLILSGGGLSNLLAQDLGPALEPAAVAPENLDRATAATPIVEAAPVQELRQSGTSQGGEETSWRYKQHQGRWWYWLPSNRWVVWMDGRWVDPPTRSILTDGAEGAVYQSAPRYVAPGPAAAARLLQPRPQSWYYSDRVYDGPRYYYDEFYEPYGGGRPYPYYPVPRPSYPRGSYYGGYPYGYGEPGVGISVGGRRSGVRIGIGF